MARCRVFIKPDGSLRIMKPNMANWDASQESEEDYCQRICEEDMKKDTLGGLSGLPYRDINCDDLPKDTSRRSTWRWSDSRGVYVEEA